MPQILLTDAQEESTYIITADFTDEAGDAVIPTSIAWTLSDIDGTVINSRTSVVVTPASSINIVLTGDDLSIVDENKKIRVLTIKAVYNSTYGNGLTLKKEARFNVENLVNVS